jgi:hypothetical protein
MNIREHKRAYLSAILITVSVVILWLLILWTGSRTIPVNDALKSGIEGSAVVAGDCKSKGPCPSKRIAADVSVTDANGKSMKTRVSADGTFTMKLAPGMYTASAVPTTGQSSPKAPSQQVTVVKDKFTRITFNFE